MVGPARRERDVLHERAAERDVDHLAAAAHAEQGPLALECALHELELELVAMRVGRAERLVRLLAVTVRVDVPSAADHDRVDEVERVVEDGVEAAERERDPAGERDRSLEADALVVAEVVVADREADHRLLAASSHWPPFPSRRPTSQSDVPATWLSISVRAASGSRREIASSTARCWAFESRSASSGWGISASRSDSSV